MELFRSLQVSSISAGKRWQIVVVIRTGTQAPEGHGDKMPVPGDTDYGQGQDAQRGDPALALANDINEQRHDQEADGQKQKIRQVFLHDTLT